VFCPKCKTDGAHRSHRRGVKERLASLVAFYPYRCLQCDHRFLRFRYQSEGEPGWKPTPVEREIKSTHSARRRKRTRREIILYGVGLLLIMAFLYFVTRERTPSDAG
jgi:hypothetical protein